MPWADLIEPAIFMSRFGFQIGSDLASKMDQLGPHSFLSEDPSWALDFAPNGTRLGLGDVITRKRYADVLETIATQGPESFYAGALANHTVRAIKEANGTMTLEDLKDYQALSRPTSEVNYRDYRLVSCGAPASGSVALSAMKTVEGYPDFGQSSMVNLNTHRLDEAIRFAYGAVRCLVMLYAQTRLILAADTTWRSCVPRQYHNIPVRDADRVYCS